MGPRYILRQTPAAGISKARFPEDTTIKAGLDNQVEILL